MEIDMWVDEFLDVYYFDDILSLGSKWPESKSLCVDSKALSKFDVDVWELLYSNPDKIISDLEYGLKNFTLPMDVSDDWAPVVRIAGSEYPIRVRDIRVEKISKLITVSGIVQKISDVWPRVSNAYFECVRCGHITMIHQSGQKFVEPLECENEMCGRKGPFKLIVEKSVMVDTQKIRLQESPEDLNGGEQPQTIDVQIDGDITGIIVPGNRVEITGILRAFQRTGKHNNKTTQFDLMLEGNFVKINDTEADIEISDEEHELIKQLSERNDITDYLVSNFATSIYGYDIVKEALLTSAVSGDNIIKSDGTIQRGYAHVLICGDPSTAKSTLMKNMKQLIPRSQLATGDGSTRAGLTAAVVHDDFYGTRWSLEAGSLVLADRSVAIVDELDKMRREDIPNLNTVLSSSMIHVNKAGLNCTLWARAPVLAAMNPKDGRFDRFESIPDQINIRADTLSRFDLVYIMYDTPHEHNDSMITDLLVDSWCDYSEVNTISIDLIRKYIATARHIKNVDITHEAMELIKSHYLTMRKQSTKDIVCITTRNLEALIRLTRSEAKLRLSNIADVNDAQRAINLVNTSMSEISSDEMGVIDSSIVETGKSHSQRERAKIIRDVILNLQKDGAVKLSDIVLGLGDYNIDSTQLDYTIKQMKRSGDIFEPVDGHFKCI